LERVMRVEFRGPPAPGIAEDSRLQAIAWVRADDGLVLRQDVLISTSQLRFERLTDEESAKVGASLLGQQNSGYMRRGRGSGGRRGRYGYSGQGRHSWGHEGSPGRPWRQDSPNWPPGSDRPVDAEQQRGQPVNSK
jgi:hypothetical protein